MAHCIIFSLRGVDRHGRKNFMSKESRIWLANHTGLLSFRKKLPAGAQRSSSLLMRYYPPPRVCWRLARSCWRDPLVMLSERRARRKPCLEPSRARAPWRWVGGIRRRTKWMRKEHVSLWGSNPDCFFGPGCFTYGKGPGAPRAPTANLGQIGQQGKGGFVSQRHIDDAVMGQCAQRGNDGGFLSPSRGSGGDEDAGKLAPIASRLPLLAGGIPKGLPLGGEVSVAGGDAQQESVIAFEDLRRDEWNFRGLAGGIHLGKNLLREGLFHSKAPEN